VPEANWIYLELSGKPYLLKQFNNRLKMNLYLHDITLYPHWTSTLENG